MNTERGSALDRFLRAFTDVRPGEGTKAILLALNIFLILTAYYVLKPVREALILSEGSAELKSYMSAGQVFLLAFAVPLYAKLVSAMPRRRLINTVTAFFAVCLVVFYFLAHAGVSLGVVFFLWIGVFNMMIPAQFWSFANDVYSEEEGKRLFPIVGFGMSLGAVLGAVIAAILIRPLGVYQMMLVGAAILVMAVLVTNYVDSKERQRPEADPEITAPVATSALRTEDAPTPKRSGVFQLVFRTRYLLLIAVLMMLSNWVNTTGEYILGSVIADAAHEAVAAGTAEGMTVGEYIGTFYSQFFGVVNVVGVLMQLFLVSRIVKYLGVHKAVLFLPLIALVGYNILAFFPVLAVVRWAKTAENATDYSLNNTVRNMLFLPCTREQKYSAKQAIDSFFVRVGDVLSALVVFLGTTYFALSASGFAKFNIGLVLIWITVAALIGRKYQQLVASGQPPQSE
ncbi:MAG: MFS transporter [bacterium]|nr:MFS transporter [bacterium]